MPGKWSAVWTKKKQALDRPDKNNAVLEALLGKSGERKTILDIGCGKADGTMRYAKSRNAEVVLLDYCQEALDAAAEAAVQHGIKPTLLLSDAERTGLPTASVDIVHSEGVLEHYPRKTRARMLREAHRVLVPGGMIVVNVPNALNLPARINRRILEALGKNVYEKQKPIAPSQLARELREAGFKIKKFAGTSAVASWMLGPWFLVPVVRRKVQKRTRRQDLNVLSGPNRYLGKDIAILAVKA